MNMDSDSSSGGYEGAEKLLKLWFTSTSNNMVDLRTIPVETWSALLQEHVHCSIVSVVKDKHVHSYVLSESSMFVFRRKLILKTCGSSRLLHGLRAIIDEAKRIGFNVLAKVTYSRKQFLFVYQQVPTHADFETETSYLDDVLGRMGIACKFGRVNKTSSWNFYVNETIMLDDGSFDERAENDSESDKSETESEASETSGVDTDVTDDESGPCFSVLDTKQGGDETLEVLMTKLDPSVMRIFTRELSQNAEMATRSSGIDTIFGDAIIDDFLFDPCGYSMNGVMRNGKYLTIHITPEDAFSYVSFETNAVKQCRALVEKVVGIFKPREFTVTLTTDRMVYDKAHMELLRSPANAYVDGFGRELSQIMDSKHCNVSYAFFHREPI